jgi:hypothetical protein
VQGADVRHNVPAEDHGEHPPAHEGSTRASGV